MQMDAKANSGSSAMTTSYLRSVANRRAVFRALAASLLIMSFQPAVAQDSPFATGANSLVDEFIAIATPIAILLVMGLGIAAATGRISWGWPLLVLLGIGIVFGAPQIVEWGRALFGV
jgi:type IV secretion system protein VirB2